MWLLAWEFLLIKSVLHIVFLLLLSWYYYYDYVVIGVLSPRGLQKFSVESLNRSTVVKFLFVFAYWLRSETKHCSIFWNKTHEPHAKCGYPRSLRKAQAMAAMPCNLADLARPKAACSVSPSIDSHCRPCSDNGVSYMAF